MQYSSPSRNNYQIINQRLEIGQVDTVAGITKAFDLSNATQVTVDYDANIADVYWGQGTRALLATDPLNWNLGAVAVAMVKQGYGQNLMEFNSGMYSPAGGISSYQNTMAPVFGNYHMSAIFENGQVSQTVTNLDTGANFSSGVTAIPGFLLSNMNSVIFQGGTTTGTTTWIDNATVTITAAVPEPETYAMLLAGLGVLAAASRRRPKQIAAV